jgi:hypothetical protein
MSPLVGFGNGLETLMSSVFKLLQRALLAVLSS